jgi:hypothetical protein
MTRLGRTSKQKKRLRQGDPLSPILFNIVVDMLAIIINGVVPHLVDNGLSILQYVDDTIIFMDDNIEKAKIEAFVMCV